MAWITVNEPEQTMPTFSLEWLMNVLEHCVPWHSRGLRVVGLNDHLLADELIDFGEGI